VGLNRVSLFSPIGNPRLDENKLLIVKLGGLEPLIRQMLSPNAEVQCNMVGCVTNLATHGMPLVLLCHDARATETLS